MYFDDESEEVRKQVGHAFWRMDGQCLLELESMILKYIESRSFDTDAEDLLRVLSQSTVSTLIVRQYAQSNDSELKRHCLDLIDQMERLGYLGITDELNKIDR